LLAEADYLVELGPGGGPAGGEILYQGPIAGLFKVRRSPTAPYLKAKLTRMFPIAAKPQPKVAGGKR
jgi:excinuclease ABC subunit A